MYVALGREQGRVIHFCCRTLAATSSHLHGHQQSPALSRITRCIPRQRSATSCSLVGLATHPLNGRAAVSKRRAALSFPLFFSCSFFLARLFGKPEEKSKRRGMETSWPCCSTLSMQEVRPITAAPTIGGRAAEPRRGCLVVVLVGFAVTVKPFKGPRLHG